MVVFSVRRVAAFSGRTLSSTARLRLTLNPIPPTGTMTKIVCTLGPSTDTAEQVAKLLSNGMHVARINFSHIGKDYSYPEANMSLVRNCTGKHDVLAVTGSPGGRKLPHNLRAVLVDTKGPEIRTGPLQGNAEVAQIITGATMEITIHDVSKDPPPSSPEGPHRIQIDYADIAKSVKIGGQILLDDGLLALEVVDIDTALEYVTTVALNDGPIKKNKGVNLPGAEIGLPALTEKDKEDLKWACEMGADYVAASFIRTAANVRSVVAYLNRCVAELSLTEDGKLPLRPLVISKIESKEGVDNFMEILEESDGIMVARGDLGVEIPYSKVFAQQKRMVSACNEVGKPVIVATQMLDSMQRNPRPTRAEVTDVGTAVLDGADAVMLSGETAAGKYPIESLMAMTSVVTEADNIVDSKRMIIQDKRDLGPMERELDAVSASAVRSAKDMNAKLIILITTSGKTARAVALHRPTVPVLAFCTDAQAARRLQLHRSIVPIMLQSSVDPLGELTSMSILRAEAIRTAKELGFVRTGDRVITVDRTRGKPHDMHLYAHNMQVATIRDT
jgi:pyruvate kinase